MSASGSKRYLLPGIACALILAVCVVGLLLLASPAGGKDAESAGSEGPTAAGATGAGSSAAGEGGGDGEADAAAGNATGDAADGSAASSDAGSTAGAAQGAANAGGGAAASSGTSPQAGSSASGGSQTAPQAINITLRISCHDAVAAGNETARSVSSNGEMRYTSLRLNAGSTVYDALRASGAVVSARGGSYVYAIDGLAEKMVGAQSGWKYYVNGVEASIGCGDYILNNGDAVEWRYVLQA